MPCAARAWTEFAPLPDAPWRTSTSRPNARHGRTYSLLLTATDHRVDRSADHGGDTAPTAFGPANFRRRGDPQFRQPPPDFCGDGISIEEAVRLSLENDADIQLQREALRLQEGAVQEQAGPFDATAGSVAYDYRVTDLTSAALNAEQSERDTIANSIQSIQQADTTAQKTIDLLEQARNRSAQSRLPSPLSRRLRRRWPGRWPASMLSWPDSRARLAPR